MNFILTLILLFFFGHTILKVDLKLATQEEVFVSGRCAGLKEHMTIVKKLDPLCIAGGNVKRCSTAENYMGLPQKTKHKITI